MSPANVGPTNTLAPREFLYGVVGGDNGGSAFGGNFSLNWVAGQSTVGTNQQTVEGYQVVSATGNYSLAYGQFTSQTWGASITTYRMP